MLATKKLNFSVEGGPPPAPLVPAAPLEPAAPALELLPAPLMPPAAAPAAPPLPVIARVPALPAKPPGLTAPGSLLLKPAATSASAPVAHRINGKFWDQCAFVITSLLTRHRGGPAPKAITSGADFRTDLYSLF